MKPSHDYDTLRLYCLLLAQLTGKIEPDLAQLQLTPDARAKRVHHYRVRIEQLSKGRDTLQQWADRQTEIDELAEDGRIGIRMHLWWAVDCVDQMREFTVPATSLMVRRALGFIGDPVDDECWLRGWEYRRPSDIEPGRCVSRDRIAEAHEDGHPGVVYSGSPL